MNWALLIRQAVAFGAWVWFVLWEVRENVRRIDGNGSQDSLHQLFHTQRTRLRAAVAVPLVLLPGAWTYWGQPWLVVYSTAALLALFAAFFVRTFNPMLSVGRTVAKLARFYVSFDPDASRFPDQFLAKRAVKKYPNSLVAQQTWAEAELHHLLNWLLIGGLVLYVGLDAYTLFLAR